jgi:predicted RecA/RadA family phage recombinase|tara:strand:+ start:1619 stop:1966 length:348 start_codon:yes stop_codon:yes gene_type:complete
MALNEIYATGSQLVFPVANTVVSGDLVSVGTVVGIALEDAIAGENAAWYTTLKLDGVFKLVTADADIAVGANVYVDVTGAVTSTSTDNKFLGHCIKSGTTYVVTRLVQSSDAAAV